MKNKIISLFSAVVLLAASPLAFATGGVGVDPVQTGSLIFNVSTGFYQTNQFPFAYTTPPIVQLFAGTTNAVPITNIFVTSTNFAVSVNATNPASQVNWTAFVGYPRVQVGTNALTGGLLATNVFVTPFAAAPIIQITGASTNTSGVVGLISVTSSNFVLQSTTTQTAYWGALGIAASPGSYNPNAPSITY